MRVHGAWRIGARADRAVSRRLELDRDNATYVRCTKQELQLVMDAIAQRKEESLEFKARPEIGPRSGRDQAA